MNITTLISEAIRNLLSNKIRSILTMLGIFIGVGAVIAMVSIGKGVQTEINKAMSVLGTGNVYVMAGNLLGNARNARQISNADVSAIADFDFVEIASPVINRNLLVSQKNGETINTAISGVVPGYEIVGNYTVQFGSFITQKQYDAKEMVVVLGSESVEALFPDDRPGSILGETVRIMGQPYRVIGVLEEKGSTQTGISQDEVIFIPLSTAQNRLITQRRGYVDLLTVRIYQGEDITHAKEEIEALLRDRHGIFYGEDNDFTVLSIEEVMDILDSIMNTYLIFLGGVAAISLLVGGIGIMNIMLVTVTERTREIGLRKALGAKNSDIRMQFLIESGTLSVIGGIFGILFGVGLSELICFIARILGTTIAPTFSPYVVAGSVLFSFTIGLFFGIYPASRAAKLDPVIALRSE